MQRGASYELVHAFEDHLNKKLKTKNATKYYVAYRLTAEERARRAEARKAVGADAK